MIASESVHIDLDDSRVVRITRDTGCLKIELEQLRGNTVKRIAVNVSGVTREDALQYIGNDVAAPHPSPSLPLDFIEYASQGADYLELGGYLNNESWFAWRIVARHIEIMEIGNDGLAT